MQKKFTQPYVVPIAYLGKLTKNIIRIDNNLPLPQYYTSKEIDKIVLFSQVDPMKEEDREQVLKDANRETWAILDLNQKNEFWIPQEEKQVYLHSFSKLPDKEALKLLKIPSLIKCEKNIFIYAKNTLGLPELKQCVSTQQIDTIEFPGINESAIIMRLDYLECEPIKKLFFSNGYPDPLASQVICYVKEKSGDIELTMEEAKALHAFLFSVNSQVLQGGYFGLGKTLLQSMLIEMAELIEKKSMVKIDDEYFLSRDSNNNIRIEVKGDIKYSFKPVNFEPVGRYTYSYVIKPSQSKDGYALSVESYSVMLGSEFWNLIVEAVIKRIKALTIAELDSNSMLLTAYCSLLSEASVREAFFAKIESLSLHTHEKYAPLLREYVSAYFFEAVIKRIKALTIAELDNPMLFTTYVPLLSEASVREAFFAKIRSLSPHNHEKYTTLFSKHASPYFWERMLIGIGIGSVLSELILLTLLLAIGSQALIAIAGSAILFGIGVALVELIPPLIGGLIGNRLDRTERFISEYKTVRCMAEFVSQNIQEEEDNPPVPIPEPNSDGTNKNKSQVLHCGPNSFNYLFDEPESKNLDSGSKPKLQ